MDVHTDNITSSLNAGYRMNEIRSRLGWKNEEDNLLWEDVKRARQEGRSLKSVFDAVSVKTGRKPNSIRNYYYARIKEDVDLNITSSKNPAFVPFGEEEMRELLKTVLTDQAKGISVRACTLKMGNGDNKAMLRYQNKYRSLIKTNPALVKDVIRQLRESGEECMDPYEIPARNSVKRPGRPRKAESESLVDVLSGVVGGLGKVDGMDVTVFFESLGALAVNAVRGADAIKRLEMLQLERKDTDAYFELHNAREEIQELNTKLQDLNRQFEAQKNRFNSLLGLFRQLMNINRDFLGLNSVIKVSNLSTYIKDLSRSVEDCEKLMIEYV